MELILVLLWIAVACYIIACDPPVLRAVWHALVFIAATTHDAIVRFVVRFCVAVVKLLEREQ